MHSVGVRNFLYHIEPHAGCCLGQEVEDVISFLLDLSPGWER